MSSEEKGQIFICTSIKKILFRALACCSTIYRKLLIKIQVEDFKETFFINQYPSRPSQLKKQTKNPKKPANQKTLKKTTPLYFPDSVNLFSLNVSLCLVLSPK